MLYYSIMASVEKWKVIWCVCFVFLRTLKTESIEIEGHGPAPEFFRHVVVKPRIFHGREKRSIQSTRKHQDGLEHLHDVTLAYNLNGKEHLIDLRLNRELIPKNYFERHHKNGSTVINRPDSKNVELCHYIGKVRGAKNSWAALSTCSGLSGMVYTGESIHYIEKAKGNSSEEDDDDDKIHGKDHFVYDHKDLKVNHTCGYSGTAFHHINPDINLENTKLRYKRSTDVIHGPYNANKTSRYVELVLVVDQRDFKGHGENLKTVYTHCKKIANLINALYMPLNIFIALVGVVVWTEHDEFHIDTNGDTTLTNFLQYRRTKLVKEHPNDNAQLLTRVQFEGGVVGKALKGPICTYEFSGGVNMDHSPVVGLVATTVAHEMGHNFGMEHDGSSCECPEEKCIMASSSSSSSPTHWSSCSYEYLLLAFGHGMDYCLRNKPTSLFDSPVCGNGFVEPGEQCDCGLAGHCTNPCCNMTSCMLYSNASCATGECCDFTTCRPKTAGSVCRSADHECDLPEYCTGHSEYCPADVYKMDGETCNKGKAYCYQGSCRSHSDQCKLLWGPSGMSSDTQCYKMNLKGNRYGNCGYNRVNQSYLKCEGDNVQCGMLHCKHLNEKLEFGMESVAILSHSFINTVENEVIPCRTAIVDLGLNEVDPGLAPDGAKCGVGMMCVNQKCMNVSSLRAASPAGDCPKGCSGNGVCNSLGHCHCKLGFAPPYCDYPGTGGSLDSGPATDPHAHWEVITALYAIFFGIVPFVTIVGLITYHLRHNPSPFWRKKPRSIIMYVSKCSSFDCMKRSKGSGRNVRKVTAAPPGMPPTSHRPPDISFVGCPVEIPNSPITSHLHNSTQQSSNYQGRAPTNVLNASSFGHKHLQLAPFNSPFPDPKSQDESNTEHIYAEIKDVRKPVSEYCSTDLINTEPIYSNIPPTTSSKPGYVPMLSPKVGVGSSTQNNDILSTKHEWGSIFRDSSLYKKLKKNIAALKTEKHDDTSGESLAPSAPPAHLQPSQRPHIEIIKSDLIFSTNPMVKTLMK